MTILLIQCSQTKHPTLHRGMAKNIYQGEVFKLGLKFAQKMDWEPLVLSGRYGIITPETVIDSYDERMTGSYDGDWPTAGGYWLGGKKYFKNAPEWIHPLIENPAGYGHMRAWFYGKV